MKHLSRILAPAMIAALVVAGCGASADKPQTGGTPAPAVDPSKPVQGGVLTKSLNYGDPQNLDPIMKSDVAAQMVTMNIFDTLVKYDAVKKEIVKSVAEDYKVSDDGLTYTFKLKHGVLFHNGRELKAQDVKYTIERASTQKLSPVTLKMFDKIVGYDEFQQGAPEITGVKAADYDLTITLKQPKATLLMDLASAPAGIVPQEEAEKPDFAEKPVGSGPFKFVDWNQDDKITLAANEKYQGGRPYLDQVVFRIMKEEQTRDAEFRSGTLDAMTLGEALYKKYSADPEQKKGLVEVPELFTRAIHFNTTKAPFDNVKVRQAINYAIDKKAIVEKVLFNKAFVATGVLPSSSPAYDPNLKGYEYDQNKAKQLLKEAGLENGFTFDVLVTSSTAKWMEAINIDLNKLGINGKINQMESSTLLAKSRSGDYQATIFSTGGDVDPISFLGRFESKNFGNGGNVTLYKNEQVDKLLGDAAKVTDPAERNEIARQAEQIIVAEAPWFIFNYNKAVAIAQPWVHGLQPVPTDIDFQDLTKVWVSKKK